MFMQEKMKKTSKKAKKTLDIHKVIDYNIQELKSAVPKTAGEKS